MSTSSSNPVHWFEIYVNDMPRAKQFYQSVFQVELTRMEFDQPEMWIFPWDENGQGISGALVKMDGISPASGGSVVYFECQNCATPLERIGAAGGTVIQEKMAIGGHGFCALAKDSEGNIIGLHSYE